MKRCLGVPGASLALLVLAPAALLAHDFWIEPTNLFPKAGERLDAALRIGHHAEVEPYARNPKHAAEFYLLQSDGSKLKLLGEPGAEPAGYVERVPEGASWIVYRSNASASELAPEKFEAYLKEEGLDHVIADRLERAESERAGRERYSRAAKALVRTDGARLSPGSAVGLPAEFVLERDPIARPQASGEPALWPVLFLVAGEPRAGALVKLQAMHSAEPDRAVPRAVPRAVHRARTDKQGRAELPWPEGGAWLLTSVHMERAEGEADFEWRSQFASLRFDVPAERPAPQDAPLPNGESSLHRP